jgi:hypothetical protein
VRQGHPRTFGYVLVKKYRRDGSEVWERPDGYRHSFGPGDPKWVQHPDRGWAEPRFGEGPGARNDIQKM